MARNAQSDSTKTAALTAGTIVALGFAAWRISAVVSPGNDKAAAPPSVPASTPTQSAAQPAIPPELDRPTSVAPVADVPGGAEEALAPTADPFQPLMAAAPAAATPGPASVPATMPAFGGPVLPPNPGMEVSLAPPVRVEPVVPPTLAGTLLGDHPSAVFKTEGGLQVVRRGQQFGPWLVVAVQHGAATVRNGGVSRHLTVNMRLGSIAATPAARPTEATHREVIMAVLPTPAPPVPVPASIPAPAKAPPCPPSSPEPVPGPADSPSTTPVDAAPTTPTIPTPPTEAPPAPGEPG
jgi:hypothetical protein